MYVSLFVCFFVSLLARLRENCWTDLREIFKEGAEWPWDDLIQFWVNSEKLCDAMMLISLSAFVNITSKPLDWFSWHFQGRCGVTMGRCDSILGQFGETAQCRDGNFFVSNIMSKPLDRFAWNFIGRFGVTMGRPDYIFGQFRETVRCCDAQHGDGVCCALAPQLVYMCPRFCVAWLWSLLVMRYCETSTEETTSVPYGTNFNNPFSPNVRLSEI